MKKRYLYAGWLFGMFFWVAACGKKESVQIFSERSDDTNAVTNEETFSYTGNEIEKKESSETEIFETTETEEDVEAIETEEMQKGSLTVAEEPKIKESGDTTMPEHTDVKEQTDLQEQVDSQEQMIPPETVQLNKPSPQEQTAPQGQTVTQESIASNNQGGASESSEESYRNDPDVTDDQERTLASVHEHDLYEYWWYYPDCTSRGYYFIRCRNCDYEETGTDEEKLAPFGHRADEGTVSKAATCMHEGIMEHHCTVCNAALEDTSILVNPNAHVWVRDELGVYCDICNKEQ